MMIDLIVQTNCRKWDADEVLLRRRVRYIHWVERVVAGWGRIQEKQLLMLLLLCVSTSVALHITVRVHQIKCLNIIIISMMMMISLYIIIRGSSIVHSCCNNNYLWLT